MTIITFFFFNCLLFLGINISCPPNIKHIGNSPKIIGDNITIKAQSILSSKSSSAGTITPTSDLVDDSGVSEDNASSVNSGSEHGGDTYPHSQPTSIIHLGPDGNTVIEYKSTPRKINSPSSTLHSPATIVKTTVNGNCSVIASTVNSIGKSENIDGRTVDIASNPHTHFHKRYIKAMNALNSIDPALVTVSTTSSMSVQSSCADTRTQPATIHAIPMSSHYTTNEYEHSTVIVENDSLAMSNHYIQVGNDDRHSDEYVTPISSPRQQSQPSAPQKSVTLNANASGPMKTPPIITMAQTATSNTVPAPSHSPNASHQNPVSID